jgi:pSer/pThr/pTyr-binding forkhead associated (FHA) protein
MPKLMLRFSNRLLKSIDLEEEKEVTIGRDKQSDISIDSIRCGPLHARVVHQEDNSYRMLAEAMTHFPLVVNGREEADHPLNHGDILHFGDYSLEYVDNAHSYRDDERDDGEDQRLWKVKLANTIPAFLQILNGPKMGRIIKLSHEVTPLTTKNGKCATIIQRGNDHFLVPKAQEGCATRLNDQPLEAGEACLKNGDEIEVDGLRIAFMQD